MRQVNKVGQCYMVYWNITFENHDSVLDHGTGDSVVPLEERVQLLPGDVLEKLGTGQGFPRWGGMGGESLPMRDRIPPPQNRLSLQNEENLSPPLNFGLGEILLCGAGLLGLTRVLNNLAPSVSQSVSLSVSP